MKTITTKDWIDLINENKQLNAQLAKANERVRELESQVEFKIKECVELAQACSRYKTRAEQPRKDQNQC